MKKTIFIMAFIFLFIIPLSFSQVSFFSVDLSKTKYAPDKPLSGSIAVDFEDLIYRDSFIEVNLDGKTQRLKWFEIFDKIPLTYEVTPKKIMLKNFLSEITFDFSGKGKKEFGFELPMGSNVKSINFKITGLDNNPKSPKLDFVQTGYNEFEYFGPRIGWSANPYTSKGLNLQSTNIGILQLTKNDIAKNFCEVINIPKTKDVLINVRYKLKEDLSDYFNLTAGIYSYDGNYLQGENKCQLPNPTSSMGWHSCEISYPEISFEGEYHVCYTIEDGSDSSNYEAVFESSGNLSSSYYCYGQAGCQSWYPNDYLITVNTGEHDSSLNSQINLSEWTTSGIGYILFQINEYLKNCSPHELDLTDTKCIVPVTLSVESLGKIKLSELSLLYDAGGASVEVNNFADVDITHAKITNVAGTNISGYSALIPLSVFNEIKTPAVPGTYNLVINTSFGESSEEKIFVIENLSYAKPVAEEGISLVDEAKRILSSSDPQFEEIYLLLGINKVALTSSLESKKQALQTVLASTGDDEKKRQDASGILDEIGVLLTNVPKSILGLSKVIDSSVLLSPEEIPSEVATDVDKEAVYAYQDRLEVLYEIKEIAIVDFLNNRREGTLIKKTVKPKTDLEAIEIFEVIPKSVASDLSKINFTENPIVVSNDPIVKWKLNQLSLNSQKEITYLVEGNHLSKAGDFLTIIVANSSLPSQAPQYICGDGICAVGFEDRQSCPKDCKTKIPLLLISIILGILLVAVFFILFFKNMKVFVLGNPFKSQKDFENVTNYVVSSLEKKLEEANIISLLLTKGWTNQQISYAIQSAKNILKEKEAKKEEVNKVIEKKK